MAKYKVIGILLLCLACFLAYDTAGAVCALNTQRMSQGGDRSKFSQGAGVLSTIVVKISGGVLYAKNGKTYDISGARIITNGKSLASATEAELDFVNGEVAQVILR